VKRVLLLCLVATVLGGCERAMQDMYDQPRYRRMQPAPEFADGASVRPLPEGSVPRVKGPLASTSSARVGLSEENANASAERAEKMPYRIDMPLLQLGRERFTIYCSPCHSPAGDGDGRVAQRGFPRPPSYHIDRLRNAPDRHFYDVMTNGYGIMYSYADRVTPAERWAIVAYIRALQLSQHADVARLPEEARSRLQASVGKKPR
jgi:mono/diheme cytochrome c family protein